MSKQVTFDYSKNRFDEKVLESLLNLAAERQVPQKILPA